MKVALLQYPIVWADPQANLRLTEERIRALLGQTDIALLPEMFSTGFCVDRPDLAERTDGETITRLQALADDTDIAIAGSFISCDQHPDANGKLHNRGFFIRPHEAPDFIDKKHLYAHGGEDRIFSAGNDRRNLHFRGVNLRLCICYDLRFPIWLRNDKDNPYDILLVVANWPEVRIQYWDALLGARATENQAYLCAVNCVGDDGAGLHYNGHSIAYDTRLQPIAQLADNEAGTRIADLDIDKLHHFRQVLPLWQDADDYEIIRTPLK